MDVSMDGLRWHLLDSYNSLTRKLNNNIKKYETFGNEIVLSPDNIQREMDDILMCIITLAHMYDNRPEGFKELENPTFERFNEQETE